LNTLNIQSCPSPHYNERPAEALIDLLVIHNISLPPEQFGGDYIHQFFQGNLDCSIHPYFDTIKELQVSSHYLIDRTGKIFQFVDCRKRAWHAGVSSWQGRENCNDFSIGIELEGSDAIPYTKEQYQSLVILTKQLQHEFPAITNQNIVGHCDIAPGRKTDPGEAFDWEYFHSLLTAGKL